MLRTDTGNFNRFLTSLGLLMLLGALLVPYFYFHDTETLRIPVEELKELTPVARDALETRQRRAHDLEAAVLVLAGALALCGMAALWFGVRRLRVAQGKEDDEIDRKARLENLQFEKLSHSEVAEKREEQIRESIEEEKATAAEEQAVTEDAPPPHQRTDTATRIRDSRAVWMRIEAATKEVLEEEEPTSYEFFYEVKTSGPQQLQLDGIFQSKKRDQPDVILELKVSYQSRTIRNRARMFSDQLLALQTRYKRVTNRDALGWLVVVLPADAELPTIEDRRQLEDGFDRSLVGIGKATLIHESELGELGQRFRRLFESQAK